jgi:hypothetical protein
MNGSIISTSNYKFIWFNVLVIEFIRYNCKDGLNEEVNTACI